MRAALYQKVSSKSWKLLLLFRFTFCSPNVFQLVSINRLTQELEIFYRSGKLNINSPVCNEKKRNKNTEKERRFILQLPATTTVNIAGKVSFLKLPILSLKQPGNKRNNWAFWVECIHLNIAKLEVSKTWKHLKSTLLFPYCLKIL